MATYNMVGGQIRVFNAWPTSPVKCSGDTFVGLRAWGSVETTDYPDRVDIHVKATFTYGRETTGSPAGNVTGTFAVKVNNVAKYNQTITRTPGKPYVGETMYDATTTIYKTHSQQSIPVSIAFSVTGNTLKRHAAIQQGTSDPYMTEWKVYTTNATNPGSNTTQYSYSTVTITVPVRTSYTVNYAANGGSSTPGAQTKWYNETLTPLASAISRTGYSFYKWKATNGSLYDAGSSGSYTANAGTTLTAQWTANTYTVVYNGNGNTGGSTASSSHTYDTAKNLTTNGFTKTDYLFKGWATSQNGPVVYTNGQSVTNLTATQGATINLYAVWEYAYTNPNILSVSVERVNGSHALEDTGTNAKVTITANPAGKKTAAGGSASPISTRIQIYYKRSISDASEPNMLALTTYDTINTADASSTQYIDATSTGKTGFAIGPDEQCDILIIAQGIDGNAVKCTAQRTALVQTTKFILDFNGDSQYDSVGLFGVAPNMDDVLYVNGDILIEVDSNSGTDELYNAIHALGWDDVLVN